MSIINRVKGRLAGYLSDYKSHYWEYASYFEHSSIEEKTILFESFGGKNFQGNPFYIFKSIFTDPAYIDYRLCIASQDPSRVARYLADSGLMDARVEIVPYLSREYRKTLSTAKYLVNNVSFNLNFIIKPEQVYLNTWHGTPMKSLGRKILNDPFEMCNGQRNFLLCDHLIAPNEFMKQVYLQDYMVDGIMPGQLHLQGYPRNSVFFDETHRKSFREKYSLDNYTAILYMPTWRGTANGVDKIDIFSEMENLAKHLGDRYKLFVKLHPAMLDQTAELKNIYFAPDDCEIYEFCNACDVLITDYSSVLFDYCNTNKPIILYQYDRDTYFRSRGVYSDVWENLPFPVAKTFEELEKLVKNPPNTDVSVFQKTFCVADNLQAAEAAKTLLLRGKVKKTPMPLDLYIIDFPVTDEDLLRWRDALRGQTYRFAFVPYRGNQFAKLTCFNQIDYLVLYRFNRLSLAEKFKYALADGLYRITKAKCFLGTLQYYVNREQRRLWGNTIIGKIYSCGRKKPVAVRFAEEWTIK